MSYSPILVKNIRLQGDIEFYDKTEFCKSDCR